MRIATLGLCLMTAMPAAVHAQTGRISGRVIDAATGEPIRRAEVILGGSGIQTTRTLTDATGLYEFADLPAGSFTVTASKNGFVHLTGRPFETGESVLLRDGATREGVDFSMSRAGVIVTRVIDDLGEPLAMVQVQLQRIVQQPDGQRRLTPVVFPGSLALTNDRGEIRAFGLLPGEYVISASPRPTSTSVSQTGAGFALTFYPGVVSAAQARPVAVAAGEEVPVTLPLEPARLASVTGAIADSSGRPVAGAQIMLRPPSVPATPTTAARVASAAANGTFAIPDVAPGVYTLDVRPRGSGEFAVMPLVVAGVDITGLHVRTSAGTVVSGRVIFEGAPQSAAEDMPVRITLGQADLPGRPPVATADAERNGTVDANGGFVIAGAHGRVLFGLVNVGRTSRWTIVSVRLDGRDITAEPIDLTGRASLANVVVTMRMR